MNYTMEPIWNSTGDPEYTDVAMNTTDEDEINSNISPFNEVALRAVYITIGCLGLMGNMCVLIVMIKQPKMRKKFQNMFIMNQSCIDFCAASFIVGQGVFPSSGSGLSGLGDELLCSLWLTRAPLWSMLMSSTYNLLFLTGERYFAIVHPLYHKNNCTEIKIKLCMLAAWLIGPVYNLAYEVPTTKIIDGECYPFSIWPSSMTQRIVGVLTFLLQYFLPLVVISACYTRMALMVHSRVVPMVTQASGGVVPAINPKMVRARKNIIKTLVIVSICFILCWTSNEFFILLYFLGHPTDFSGSFYHFTVVAVFTNCCVNPFIYAAKYEEFQTGLRHLLGIGSKVHPNSVDTSSTRVHTAEAGNSVNPAA